jgi:hypothetical protein
MRAQWNNVTCLHILILRGRKLPPLLYIFFNFVNFGKTNMLTCYVIFTCYWKKIRFSEIRYLKGDNYSFNYISLLYHSI